MRNGFTSFSHAFGSLTNAGSTGCQTPGAGADREPERAEAAVVGTGRDHRRRGSLAHRDSARLLRPAGIAPSDAAYCASSVAFWAGTMLLSTRKPPSPPPRPSSRTASRRRDEQQVSLMPAVDRVNGVVDGAVHHRQMRHGDPRVAGPATVKIRGPRAPVPLRDRVGVRGSGSDQRSQHRQEPVRCLQHPQALSSFSGEIEVRFDPDGGRTAAKAGNLRSLRREAPHICSRASRLASSSRADAEFAVDA